MTRARRGVAMLSGGVLAVGCSGGMTTPVERDDGGVPAQRGRGSAAQAGADESFDGFRVRGHVWSLAVDDAGRAVVAYSERGQQDDNRRLLRTYEPASGWSEPETLVPATVPLDGVHVARSPGGFFAFYAVNDGFRRTLAVRRWFNGHWGSERVVHSDVAAELWLKGLVARWEDGGPGLLLWAEAEARDDFTPEHAKIGTAELTADGPGAPHFLDHTNPSATYMLELAPSASGWIGAFSRSAPSLHGIGFLSCRAGAPCAAQITPFDARASVHAVSAFSGGVFALVHRTTETGTQASLLEQAPDLAISELALPNDLGEARWLTLTANPAGHRVVTGARGGSSCRAGLVVADVPRGQGVSTHFVEPTAGLGFGEARSAVSDSGQAIVVWSEGDIVGYGDDCFGTLLRAQFRGANGWSTPIRLAGPAAPGEWMSGWWNVQITQSGRALLSYSSHEDEGTETIVRWLDPPR